MMNCYFCDNELSHREDDDLDDENFDLEKTFDCINPECEAVVVVYRARKEEY